MKKKNINIKTMEKLKAELNDLKTNKRSEIAKRLKEAISFGDLKENAAYHEAKDDQAFLEGKIIDIENIIKNSSVSKTVIDGRVNPGSLVTVEIDGDYEDFEIVNVIEADPLEGKISEESPIGKALMGYSEGDICEIETPSGEKKKYKIVKIK
ncbi:MAG: transcription elongation factor GreA [Candidatus Pacebacteria bacterium]|nr:transcription elongation factor GreA [Candidatus Paceibacterota bacterium]